jgi:hypothetical protein
VVASIFAFGMQVLGPVVALLTRLAVLDSVLIVEALERADARLAEAW